jgi:hypothetical protein
LAYLDKKVCIRNGNKSLALVVFDGKTRSQKKKSLNIEKIHKSLLYHYNYYQYKSLNSRLIREFSINGQKIPSNVAKKLRRLYLKMVGSNGTMIAIRLVRSKLRKREDHGNDQVNTEQPSVVQTATSVTEIISTTTSTSPTIIQTSADIRNNGIVNDGATITTNELTNGIIDGNTTFVNETNADQFIWQFPPPYPPSTPPPQYTLYNDQDTLVHGLQTDRPGFAKGIKKNIGGRWRRLVKKKPESETCAIPPELKDQLKTIYVY